MEQTLRTLIEEESERVHNYMEKMFSYIIRCQASIMQYGHAYTGQLVSAPSIFWDAELDQLKEKYPAINFDAPSAQAQQFKARYDEAYAKLALWTIRREGASYARDLAIRQAIELITGMVLPNTGEHLEDLDEELENLGY